MGGWWCSFFLPGEQGTAPLKTGIPYLPPTTSTSPLDTCRQHLCTQQWHLWWWFGGRKLCSTLHLFILPPEARHVNIPPYMALPPCCRAPEKRHSSLPPCACLPYACLPQKQASLGGPRHLTAALSNKIYFWRREALAALQAVYQEKLA